MGALRPPRLCEMFQSPQYVPRSLVAYQAVRSFAQLGAPKPWKRPDGHQAPATSWVSDDATVRRRLETLVAPLRVLLNGWCAECATEA
eukprot:3399133-Pyramimonas_sp.AAC.5